LGALLGQAAVARVEQDQGGGCDSDAISSAMRQTVILTHPDPASFNAAVADAYAEAVRTCGHEAVVRDLYRLQFDPRLALGELPGHASDPFPIPEVAAEREALASSDVIVFVYPLWFNAPPAMLKGYVERVMGPGFGFETARGRMEPLLQGKSLVTVSTSGAPDQWVDQTGALQRLR